MCMWGRVYSWGLLVMYMGVFSYVWGNINFNLYKLFRMQSLHCSISSEPGFEYEACFRFNNRLSKTFLSVSLNLLFFFRWSWFISVSLPEWLWVWQVSSPSASKGCNKTKRSTRRWTCVHQTSRRRNHLHLVGHSILRYAVLDGLHIVNLMVSCHLHHSLMTMTGDIFIEHSFDSQSVFWNLVILLFLNSKLYHRNRRQIVFMDDFQSQNQQQKGH